MEEGDETVMKDAVVLVQDAVTVLTVVGGTWIHHKPALRDGVGAGAGGRKRTKDFWWRQ